MAKQWAAIVGRERHGRVKVVWALTERLRAAGIEVGGVVQEAADGTINLVDIATNWKRPIATTSPNPDVCDWRLRQEVFEEVREDFARSRADLVFLHAGRVEAQGRGHWKTVLEQLERATPLVLCMPQSSLARLALDLPDPVAALELPASPAEVDAFAAELAELALESGVGLHLPLGGAPEETPHAPAP